MCDHMKREKKSYIHDLLDVFNNPIKLQLHWMRTLNFQFKLFDTPVTLKYGQCH